MVCAVITGGTCIELLTVAANAKTNVEITAIENKMELRGIDDEGEVRFRIPLFEVDGIQYFSAGVGIEERQAAYPPFSLKLVFVAGARAFLTSASVNIRKDDESITLNIPMEHVTGPWLFVNLPPGIYTITGKYSGYPDISRRVVLPQSGTTRVILRWPKQ